MKPSTRKGKLDYDAMKKYILEHREQFVIGNKVPYQRIVQHFRVGIAQAYIIKHMVEEELKKEGA